MIKLKFNLSKGTYGKLIIVVCLIYLFVSNVLCMWFASRVDPNNAIVVKDILISSNITIGTEFVALMVNKIFKNQNTKGNEENVDKT